MRTVELWTCSCGIQYRAICELDPAKSHIKTSFVCPRCAETIQLQGNIVICSEQNAENHWLPVDSSK